jgi:hypothetical protein
MGFEPAGEVATGLGVGCNAGLGVVNHILDFYSTLHFINPDGSFNEHTVVEYVTKILIKYGLKLENTIQTIEGLTIYPIEYFCPMSIKTGKLNITEKTYSIHHYDGSWLSKQMKCLLQEKVYIENTFKNKVIKLLLKKLCVLKKVIFEKTNI